MADIKPILEAAGQEFAASTANPPFLFDLPVAEGRKTVDSVQDGDIPAPPCDVTDLKVAGGPSGEVSIKIFRPQGASGVLPVVLFTHGAGWVFGDAHTHGRLVAELATRAGAAAVFTNYSLSPEARYPTASEEIYATLEWIAARGAGQGLDPARIAVAGDSVGGNMTAAITIMAKQRSGPAIAAQLLYYPVTNASFDTGSYEQFATQYWLTRQGMQWYWGQSAPSADDRARASGAPGTSPPPAPTPARRPPPRPCGRAWRTWPGFRRRWSSSARPTCCVTRERPTPPSSGRPARPSPPSATRASSTTSSWSTPCATPMPPWPPPPRAGSSSALPCTTSR